MRRVLAATYFSLVVGCGCPSVRSGFAGSETSNLPTDCTDIEIDDPATECIHNDDSTLDDCDEGAGPKAIVALGMVSEVGLPNYCGELFHDPQFSSFLEPIHPVSKAEFVRIAEEANAYSQQEASSRFEALDPVTKRLFTALMKVSAIRRCARFEFSNSLTVQARYDHTTGVITVYAGACTAADLYDADVRSVIAGFRYALILGHELGHVVDFAIRGNLPLCTPEEFHTRMECRLAENRATAFGTFLAACYGRAMRENMRRVLAARIASPPKGTAPRRTDVQTLNCIETRWGAIESQLAQLRGSLSSLVDSGLGASEQEKDQAVIEQEKSIGPKKLHGVTRTMSCAGSGAAYLSGIDVSQIGSRSD